MNVALWIVQGILALLFLTVGLMKLTQDKEKLARRMPFVEDFSPGTIRLIGTVELLGAAGIILPALTGILPWLAPSAAVGLSINQFGAAWTHLRRREYLMIGANIVILALAVFVAYGRFVSEPF
ncbi:MAG: DoxX family protein [Dehalococcoidales bacterium]